MMFTAEELLTLKNIIVFASGHISVDDEPMIDVLEKKVVGLLEEAVALSENDKPEWASYDFSQFSTAMDVIVDWALAKWMPKLEEDVTYSTSEVLRMCSESLRSD